MRADILTPLVKAWGTDVGVEVASQGIQVHGGMGFVEETGAAQHYRDARIAPIYEGTNGIQAADLVGRKLGLEGGAAFARLLNDLRSEAAGERQLIALLGEVEEAAIRAARAGHDDRLAASYPLLTMTAVAVAGGLMARSLRAAEADRAAGHGDRDHLAMKAAACRFFLDQIVPEARGLAAAAMAPAEVLYQVEAEAFAA
ncbi:MAG: 3-methylmercaptopropionyl-CoA dehydrogenase (DmdC) [uncultured Sphingomonadaceae bacterium]|uniref:3-methylmercaptopropionyl-CoA dehydrogenase (DmdC) n=1 Tax=uncultured Sphingomonadaceae bacterium TaxID=169976 RepID=A0A6J4S6B6_9SPHN|nr:MAG: 3-methylmercaptopropionyl-CoA dehydrogenase (DmdC) [uncultured Sphingomonadaceae bacterium]